MLGGDVEDDIEDDSFLHSLSKSDALLGFVETFVVIVVVAIFDTDALDVVIDDEDENDDDDGSSPKPMTSCATLFSPPIDALDKSIPEPATKALFAFTAHLISISFVFN